MIIPSKTINQMQELSQDKLSFVINVVEQLSFEKPTDLFMALCENGGENPMTNEEIHKFVSEVREERNAISN